VPGYAPIITPVLFLGGGPLWLAAPETRGGNNRRAPPARDRREARLRHMTPPARRHALSVQPRRA